MPRSGKIRTPPVRVLGEKNPFPVDHAPLISLLKQHYYSEVYVRLIPTRASLIPSKQGAYNWLADVRDNYGLAAYEVSDQTIMSLQGDDPDLISRTTIAMTATFVQQ